MAARSGWNWLKMAWETQPILVLSVVFGTVGPLLVLLGPGSKNAEIEIRNWPNRYKCK